MSRLAFTAIHALILLGPVTLYRRAWPLPHGLACALVLLVLGTLELRAAGRDPPTGREASLAAGASGIGLLFTAWLAIAAPPASPWHWLGLALAIGGIGLRLRAIAALGDGFTSALLPRGPLVEHGIYRRLRHPSDAGLVLVAVGVAILGGRAVAFFPVLGLLLPSVALRIAREENALAGRFRPPPPRLPRAGPASLTAVSEATPW